ncbi:MAG: sensor histidine kinase [Alphaproteobacteria bacterium]
MFALLTIPSMAAIALAVADVRRSRDVALAAAANAARKDAEMSSALLEAERNYTRARDIAAQRTRQISTVSHDIRQPIGAMRAELDSLKGEIAADNAERLERILNHFDALTDEYSRSGAPGAADSASMTGESENVPVSLLFSMLKRMFDAEAKSKGVDLRFVASACVFHVPAVILMRICANLVSNAILHAHATRILIGVRRTGGDGRLEILDDEIGFPSSDVDSALAAGVKGDDSEGSGLGLSIVRELSAAHDLDLRYQSHEGRGASFSISVPTST